MSNNGGKSWTIIGNSIDAIEGYEITKPNDDFYAIDYDRPAHYISKDGFHWTPITANDYNQTVLYSRQFIRRKTVPAISKKSLRPIKMDVWIGMQRI